MVGMMTEHRSLKQVLQQSDEPAWREWDYSLVLFPEGDGGEKVRRLAALLQHGSEKAAGKVGSPCISLGTFRGREAMEDTLIRWVQRVCRMQQRFRIEVKGPCVHPAGGWLLKVVDQGALTKLTESLAVIVDEYLHSCGKEKVVWSRSPHCRISEGQDRQSPDVRQKRIEEMILQTDFMVHSLVLMKEEYEGGHTEMVNVFPFHP
jgi:hypothetical protein